MTFRDQVRLEIGDTDVDPDTNALFTDDELDVYIDRHGDNVLTVAAALCDALATRFATDFDFEWQSGTNARGKFTRSQMAKAFADRAVALRARAERENGAGLSTIPLTKEDAFSIDASTRDDQDEGTVRAGWANPDELPS